jgi:hypothetical protein
MKNRRGFLGALSGTALGFAMAAAADPPTTAGNAASARDKGPSAAALAIAARFRAFDPKLSAADVRTIASAIDLYRTGGVLNPRKKPLRNSDEPVLRFAAGEHLGG